MILAGIIFNVGKLPFILYTLVVAVLQLLDSYVPAS